MNRGQVHLDIQDLSLHFGGVQALHHVNLEVPRGILFSLIGPNGAGKTSLINCISKFYEPNSGKIVFNGREITSLRPHTIARFGISRTFQNIELFKGMTVLDNLLIGRHVHQQRGVLAGGLYWGAAKAEEITNREIVEDIVDFLEIQHIRKKVVGTLAYGLQKRVELARALALEPRLLLLDEPMAGMNAEEKEDMARFVLDISEDRGTTIVMIEHDMGVVMDISHRVTVLSFGEKIADGTPEEVQGDAAVQEAYLGQSQAQD